MLGYCTMGRNGLLDSAAPESVVGAFWSNHFDSGELLMAFVGRLDARCGFKPRPV
jgi:hypothetical protein